MIRTVSIVPTILSGDKQDFRAQAERINAFTRRVQIDVADGTMSPNQTLDITNIWWPKNWETDLHLIVAHPSEYLDTTLKLSPSLCICHAEAQEDLIPFFNSLKEAGIKCGVAILPGTYPGNIKQYIDIADHVLIFAGNLGAQGGQADLMQIEKIPLIRNMKPEVEIGWDGGANLSNVRELAHVDLDVINVGSAIAAAEDPDAVFESLVAEIDKNGVVV